MKPIVAIAILLSSASFLSSSSFAQAQGRPSTTNMSCAQAASTVARSGAIVLATGRDLYDRYVASEGLCPSGLYGRPAFVPTRDNPQCHIGYYCTSAPPLFSR